jgi:hypothetical protein
MAQIIAAILAVALLSVSPHDMSEDVRKVINHCVQPPCQGSLTS